VDLLPVVFNLAVVNEFNANGDGMDSATAAEVISLFKSKPLNIEHEKKEIVGHILEAFFSWDEKPERKPKDQKEFVGSTDPYYITAFGVIYKHVFPELCRKIEQCSDENESCYGEICTSWEIGFNKFKVARGSSIMKDCEVIEGADALLYKPHLKAFGGSGVDTEGELVYRMFAGKVLPLGGALTLTPAAKVVGVYVAKENFISKNSLNKQTNVIPFELQEANTDMTPEQQEKFIDEIQKAVASADSKTIPHLIKDSIKEFAKSWDSQIESAKKEKESLASSITELTETLKTQTDELESLKQQMNAKASVERFNVRMNAVDELFKLDSQELEIIANDVKGLGESEEDFENYLGKAKVLFKSCLKSSIEEQEKLAEEKIQAEVERRLEEAKASATTSTTTTQTATGEEGEIIIDGQANASVTPPNTNSGLVGKSLFESLEKNFKVNVKL
jgi:hypothetical protein